MTQARNKLGSWRIRRAFMFAVSGLCAWVIIYVVTKGADTRVNETAVMFAFITLAAIVGSYVFGAVWEDVSSNRSEPSNYSAYPATYDDRPR